jgi:hypothetical protein
MTTTEPALHDETNLSARTRRMSSGERTDQQRDDDVLTKVDTPHQPDVAAPPRPRTALEPGRRARAPTRSADMRACVP